MASWKILTILCFATVFAESRWYQHQKRETKSTICDPVQNNTNKVQCFCGRVSKKPLEIANADCYQTEKNVSQDDPSWEGFIVLQNVSKLTLTNTRGIAMNYIPTKALRYTKEILRLDVKYCNIDKIESFAFANLSLVKDIILRDNQVRVLASNAFAHHLSLKTLSLDQNNIAEINRNVFVNLPVLEQLFLTGNKISTIHDRAFIHLTSLKELEIDKNTLFSLNSETFYGLKNLEKLELSSNSLEVIGDNTFVPFANLRFLNLGENKIQMLDEKAFNGLAKLNYLALPSNKISAIENEKVFEPLTSLSSLSLKDNQIRLIKPEAIATVLNNFYNTAAQIFLEGNHLPCDCNLEVFEPILNKTQNERLKLEIQNLQCYPSEEIKQKWEKFQEIGKAGGQVFEDEETQENGAYEYYDETELNGTLFYFDMRHLLNCSGDQTPPPVNIVPTTTIPFQKPRLPQNVNYYTTKVTAVNVISTTTESLPFRNNQEVHNSGTLDLFNDESSSSENPTTIDKIQSKEFVSKSFGTGRDNEISREKAASESREDQRMMKKENIYTTSRLATVSAKPLDHKSYDDHDMASDEAKPDRIKAHRSVQEQVKDLPEIKANNAPRSINFVFKIVLTALLLRLFL